MSEQTSSPKNENVLKQIPSTNGTPTVNQGIEQANCFDPDDIDAIRQTYSAHTSILLPNNAFQVRVIQPEQRKIWRKIKNFFHKGKRGMKERKAMAIPTQGDEEYFDVNLSKLPPRKEKRQKKVTKTESKEKEVKQIEQGINKDVISLASLPIMMKEELIGGRELPQVLHEKTYKIRSKKEITSIFHLNVQ